MSVKSWSWSVAGTQVSTGTVSRSLEMSGTVTSELAGDVLIWLASHGPFWGLMDSDEPMTLRLQPALPEGDR